MNLGSLLKPVAFGSFAVLTTSYDQNNREKETSSISTSEFIGKIVLDISRRVGLHIKTCSHEYSKIFMDQY